MQKVTKIILALLTLTLSTGVGLAATGKLSFTSGTPQRVINRVESETALTNEDIASVLRQTRSLMNRPGVTPSEIEEVNNRLSRSVQTFYQTNLPAIITSLATKPDTSSWGTRAFENLSRTDLRADLSYRYRERLLQKVAQSNPIDPKSEDFQALVYVERKRGTGTWGLDQATMKQIVLAEKWLLKFAPIEETASILPKEISEPELIDIFDELGYMPWSVQDMRAMRRTIVSEGLSMNSRYTWAYLSARMIFTPGAYKPRTYLRNTLRHEKQFASLSCEANSFSHFYNFYADSVNAKTAKAKTPWFVPYPGISERSAFELFPKNSRAPEYRQQDGRTLRIWGDPEREFVGDVSGKQSSSSSKLTGYGIHAQGVIGPLNKELASLGYTAKTSEFSELRVLWNILRSEPVYFWFVLSDAPKEGFAKIEWQTTTGEKRTGYIGEHTGIIIGAEINTQGRISQVAYYEWRSDSLTWGNWGDLARKASYFNTMITARKIER